MDRSPAEDILEHADWTEVCEYVRERAAIPARLEARYARAFNESSLTCAKMSSPGMLPWLATARPALHDDLTVRLPDFILRLWTAHAPMAEFRRALYALERATVKAAAMFFAHKILERGRR